MEQIPQLRVRPEHRRAASGAISVWCSSDREGCAAPEIPTALCRVPHPLRRPFSLYIYHRSSNTTLLAISPNAGANT